MKPTLALRSFLLGTTLLAAAPSLLAQTAYYWNQNSSLAGWGAGASWSNATAVLSNTNSDTANSGNFVTGTADTLNIGTSTVGFAGGTITIGNASTQFIGSIITGSANNTAGVSINPAGAPANGILSFDASGTITNNSSQGLTIGTVIAGATTRLDLNATGGGITMSGSGNTYTGITYVNVGTVISNNAASLGASGTDANRTVVASGARLSFNNTPRTYTERFEIAGAGVGGTTGALSNGQTATNLNGLVSLSAAATIHNSSGTLTIGSVAATGGISLGSNALTFNAAGGTITVSNTGISGTNGSVVKSGGSTLNLNVASTYTGGTTVSAGTLTLGNATALGSTSGQLTVNTGGTLNLAGNSITVGNLTGSGGVISGSVAGTRTLTIGQGNTGGGTFQGAINDGALGTTALTKTGSGTITLSGTNGYTGATAVNAGTLNIATGGSTSASSAVSVSNSGSALVVNGTVSGTLLANATTTLSGSGTVSGAATVSGNLTPGNSAGLLTFGNSLALASTTATTLEIAGTNLGIDHDAIGVGTALTYDGMLTLAIGATFAAGDYTFDLFNFANQSGSFDFVTLSGLYSGSLVDDGLGVWGTTTNGGNETWTFTQSSGNLSLTVIPEPNAAALIGGFGLIALLRRRR